MTERDSSHKEEKGLGVWGNVPISKDGQRLPAPYYFREIGDGESGLTAEESKEIRKRIDQRNTRLTGERKEAENKRRETARRNKAVSNADIPDEEKAYAFAAQQDKKENETDS